MPSHTHDGDVYITPLHLAGSTAIGDPALQPLVDHGFTLQSDELANAYVTSPDQHVRLGFLPEGVDSTLWKVAAHSDPFGPPDWLATFDANTPTELVTAFTSALATSYAKDPDAVPTGPRGPAEEGFRPLDDAGWKRGNWQLTTLFTAPDGLAGLTYSGRALNQQAELRGDQYRWLLWGGQDGFSSRWYATFTSAVPVDLIAATTARLADPNPVLRYELEVPERNRSAARIRPVSPPVPTPLDVRRAAAARARSHGGRLVSRAPAASATSGSPSAVLPVRPANNRRVAAARS
ncbi:DUF317 domain-containing protein [Streptomyces sp. RY43-2]|uniref:DUF317 domain-containing protein n=1 Tax=Streptomyces macrolidinus TaxID=2952607 RepID=A0ABT0ZAB1_9ACTN|nr:DUF317 domain-containing protein [Streptomyces macrolidinus]MCN9240698.1 DUF317 domain-containing protein [Streptomyces macrolidinus]